MEIIEKADSIEDFYCSMQNNLNSYSIGGCLRVLGGTEASSMEKVLIINDCRLERKVMEDQLLNMGYNARSTDEYGCMQQLDDYCPDIVFANLTMNETTGDKLINRIKEIRPQIKCFLSSCSNIMPEDYTSQNVDGVFQTPVKLGELEQILAE